ncbi:tRNA ligase [Coniella lustricola]|uniref:tRNA ligase n=1 Tax=Coniella lustricola TaxID=2025994 RepID=A0A2T2ZZ75_9PEZI|nr:tRNA ligase [Coniella lustricola]
MAGPRTAPACILRSTRGPHCSSITLQSSCSTSACLSSLKRSSLQPSCQKHCSLRALHTTLGPCPRLQKFSRLQPVQADLAAVSLHQHFQCQTRNVSASTTHRLASKGSPKMDLGNQGDVARLVGQVAAGTSTTTPSTKAPYVAQDPNVVGELVQTLEAGAASKSKGGIAVRKTKFTVAKSPDKLSVHSWKVAEHEYKKPNLPTYARGLFTTRTRAGVPEIAIRGYNKFFNVGEVRDTKWDSIVETTQGPYELTLKENGCIIFLSGLEDGTLLVCSKHSTGDRTDVDLSHAGAGERHIEKQLQACGRTKADLARELRARNVTAVAELCDDDFEEHVLAYGPDKAGLYLHGMNVNVPEFVTYPSSLVHQFADDWGFRKVGVLSMDTIGQVKTFLDQCAETGAYEGRDVEGFVIRCKRSHDLDKVAPYDWFFKYKFEEPYLMYRQWRECTKAVIAQKPPRIRKHHQITKEYLTFATKRLAADPKLGQLYVQNHGIIALRDEFLAYKHMDGVAAAKWEELHGGPDGAMVDRNVVLVPIATIGCGKTTVAVALSKLFGFGHVQNDNITGQKRPPRFTAAVLEQLETYPAVVADRNNAERRERRQIITDLKMQNGEVQIVALNFVHDDLSKIRQVTMDRVFSRGDNHQTIQAATDPAKVKGIMENFLHRFEPLDASKNPDDGFHAVIHLDPAAGSRKNLETVVTELHKQYPSLIETMPSAEEMDRAVEDALNEYKPDLRHKIGGGGSGSGGNGNGKNKNKDQQNNHAPAAKTTKKKPLEYMSIEVPAKDITALLQKTFESAGAEESRFYNHLKESQHVQPQFHVTLMHRAAAKEFPELWDRYTQMQAELEASMQSPHANGSLGECDVVLERVVYDGRIMAIVVRLADPEGKWQCVNKVAHITIGTRDNKVKPKESNDLLQRWLSEDGQGGGGGGAAAAGGAGDVAETKIYDIGFEGRPTVKGTVKPVLSR